MIRHLYLFRHGERDGFNPNTLFQDGSDDPLTSNGVTQAIELANFLADKPIDIFVSSPYDRSLNTARIVAAPHTNVPLITDTRLVEGVYFWEPYEDQVAVAKAAKVYERVSNAMDYILATPFENIAIASHGAITRAILKYCGHAIDDIIHCECFCLEQDNNTWIITARFTPTIKTFTPKI